MSGRVSAETTESQIESPVQGRDIRKRWSRPRAQIDDDDSGVDLKSKLKKMQLNLNRVPLRKDSVCSLQHLKYLSCNSPFE